MATRTQLTALTSNDANSTDRFTHVTGTDVSAAKRALDVAVQTSTLPAGAATLAEQQAQTTILSALETDLSDTAVSGSIANTNDAVSVDINGHSSVYLDISGTFVSVLLFEAEAGDGNWNNVAAINQNNGIFFFVTVPGVNFIVPVGGYNKFRVRSSAHTSGAALISMNAGQGTNVVEIFQPVASALNAQVVSPGGVTLALDGSVAALQVSQGSTTSGQKGGIVQATVPTAEPSYATGTTNPLTLSSRGGLRTKIIGLDTAQTIRNDYSSVNVTTSAYVQLVASTANNINRLHIFDSSGQDLVLATGGAGSEVDQIQIPPGGWDAPVELFIASGSRISVKSKSATAASGILVITGLK